jgi:hypothetical protein
MTLDADHRRAFLSREENDLMTVFNLETNQLIAFLPMASGLRWTIRITTGSWKTFRYRRECTARRSIKKRAGCMRRSKKWTEKRWCEWSSTSL